MKSFREHIVEAKGVTHSALSKQVEKLYDAHKAGSNDHEVVHVKKNAHTGASSYSSGSVKANTLAYRHRAGVKYVGHPMKDDVQKLIKKHGGTSTGSSANGNEGGYIDTSDGYRHHFTRQLGSNYNTFDHEVHKKQISEEMTDDEIDAHNDSFNEKVASAHDKYITKHFGKNADVNWGSGHDEDGEHGMFTSKVFHPDHGRVYVTTHYNTKTHKVLKHEEE